MTRRVLVALLVAAAATVWASPRAAAHALLVSSAPADGASLRAPPRAVTLTFTEEPDVPVSSVNVLDSRGRSYERGPVRLSGGNPRSIQVLLTGLDKGVYTVSWRVVSRVDGHFTAGAFVFGVGVDPTEIERAATSQPSAPPFEPLETAGRLLLYAGLVAATGAAWVGGLLFASLARATRRLLVGGVAVAVGGLLVLAVAQQRAAGAPWGSFVEAPIGRAIGGRAIGLIILAGGAVLMLRTTSRAASLGVVGAAITTIAVHASAGHADTGRLAAVKVLTQLVHFGTVAIWIGGLAALLMSLREAGNDAKGRAVRRFSAVAGIALAVVAGTGIARAVAEVGSWRALVETGYGRVVTAKLVLGAVLALLGARNRWWNVPRAAESLGGLRRISRVEISVAAIVLVLTAVLASLVPARSVSLARPTTLSLAGSDFARSLRVSVEISPGLAGANVFRVRTEALRGSTAIRAVTLRLSSRKAGISTTSVRMRRHGDTWTARSAAVALPGAWQMTVFVDRGADSVEIPLTFHTRCETPAPSAPSTPRIYDISQPDGTSVQAYADPGKPGRNEVHFTFFDANGEELSMADDPRIDAFLRRSKSLDVRRFSDGHFVAGARLGTGVWTFDFAGETRAGEALTICFSDEIR